MNHLVKVTINGQPSTLNSQQSTVNRQPLTSIGGNLLYLIALKFNTDCFAPSLFSLREDYWAQISGKLSPIYW
ncbi:MAG: hypothetical protein KME64_40450 [Scytonematopsis contorta HA4267-MV1]|nr:hypothetical protein [Scytonematopsis contorta HA4267-MV1]